MELLREACSRAQETAQDAVERDSLSIYAGVMARDGVFGERLELQLLSQVTGRRIAVHCGALGSSGVDPIEEFGDAEVTGAAPPHQTTHDSVKLTPHQGRRYDSSTASLQITTPCCMQKHNEKYRRANSDFCHFASR